MKEYGAYTVKRLGSIFPRHDAEWNKAPWKTLEALRLSRYMGEKPLHFPVTEAKLAYDDAALYGIFHVRDRFVLAKAREHQDPVCLDSCVEFFFAPGKGLEDGYFNLEMNCGGILLFHFRKGNPARKPEIDPQDLDRIRIAHNLPSFIDPEIQDELEWRLEFKIPFDLLAKYCEIEKPRAGIEWRANFYKCADGCSYPHWLTWAPVDHPTPKFHLPEYFGVLKFE